MIESLNSAYLQYLPKVGLFHVTHLPALFSDTLCRVEGMWRLIQDQLMIIRCDGHKNDTGQQTLIITENLADKTAFKKYINPGKHTEDV